MWVMETVQMPRMLHVIFKFLIIYQMSVLASIFIESLLTQISYIDSLCDRNFVFMWNKLQQGRSTN